MDISKLSNFLPYKKLYVRNEVSVQENSTRYVLNMKPSKECAVYKVDDGIIKGTDTDKCDYFFWIRTSMNSDAGIFVELKGHDVPHAVKQLEATLKYPLFAMNKCDSTYARIISNRIPSNTGSSVVERAKIDFLKKYRCQLKCLKSMQPDHI
jgi:hypothetical protein